MGQVADLLVGSVLEESRPRIDLAQSARQSRQRVLTK